MKFSVLVPCYNEEKNIGRCIQSILNQNFKDFELIVINDGSTDNSLKIIKSFKDKRLKIIDKKNEGRPKALNDAIKKAKAKIIAVTDADCIVSKNWLANINKEFDDYDAIGGVYEPIGNDAISLAGNMTERIFMDFGLIPNQLPGANSAYSKNILIEMGGYKNSRKWGADAYLGMKLNEKKKKIKISSDIVVKTEYPRTFYGVIKRKFYWGGGLARVVDKMKFRLGFFIRPVYFLVLFLSLIWFLVDVFIKSELLMYSLGAFLFLLIVPNLILFLMSLVWIIHKGKGKYIKALPLMLFLPFIQEMSYFIGFLYVLIGGGLENAWR